MTNDKDLLRKSILEGKNDVAIMIINSKGPKDLLRDDKLLLHFAVKCDNLFIAQYLANNGWNPLAKKSYGDTSLALAIKRGNVDMISMLLRLIDATEEKSIIDHIKFARRRWPDDLDFIKILLNRLTVTCSNYDELADKLVRLHCPLAAAVCAFQSTELTKSMLDRGSAIDGRLDVDYYLTDAETALHLAVELQDVDHVRLLVERGAEIDARAFRNFTPLSVFTTNTDKPNDNAEILKLLLEAGASLDALCTRRRNSWQYSEIDVPGRTVLTKLLLEGDVPTLRTLLPYIDLCRKDKDGKIPLHHLVKNKHPDSLEVLRGKNIDANAPDNLGWTPRDVTLRGERAEKLRFLLERGAAPNNFEHNGDSALWGLLMDVSWYEGTQETFELLLLYGLDVHLLTLHRDTAHALIGAMDRELEFAKLVLAHLTKLESFGTATNEFYDEIIKSSHTFEEYFNSCKEQIGKLKETTVYENVTLHKLLGESEKRLIMYAHGEEFRLHYESMKKEELSIHPYYMKSITHRVDKAIATSKIKNKAACIICRMTGLPTSVIGTIAYTIVDYLDRKDFENILEI